MISSKSKYLWSTNKYLRERLWFDWRFVFLLASAGIASFILALGVEQVLQSYCDPVVRLSGSCGFFFTGMKTMMSFHSPYVTEHRIYSIGIAISIVISIAIAIRMRKVLVNQVLFSSMQYSASSELRKRSRLLGITMLSLNGFSLYFLAFEKIVYDTWDISLRFDRRFAQIYFFFLASFPFLLYLQGFMIGLVLRLCLRRWNMAIRNRRLKRVR